MGGFEKHNDKKIGLILHETDPGAVLSLSPASRSRLRNSRFGLDFLSGHANLLTLLLPTTDEQRRNQTLRSDSPIGSRANAGSGAAEEGARGSGQDRPQGLSDAINRFPAKGILGTGPRLIPRMRRLAMTTVPAPEIQRRAYERLGGRLVLASDS